MERIQQKRKVEKGREGKNHLCQSTDKGMCEDVRETVNKSSGASGKQG